MIDRDRVTAYISEIKVSLDNLKNYARLDRQSFLSSPVSIRDTKYCFIIAGQAAIDMCYHLTAKLLKKAPSDYGNCFELLGETGKFNKETLKCMANMAKFRNLLVHHYIKVDDDRVYDKLNEIDCFERFIQELKDIVKE
ncbi:MAG: DUF86 domain-containing protein [Thermodesulfovibrionales bacterium]|jgi:uncharacterized protein YutE (UPF0331/DUF86 family)|nr:DUF86 domain-containing protein [Thermodesulfovibrionales bacterium]